MPATQPADGPISRCHGYEFTRPLADREWVTFLATLRCVREVAACNEAPPAPDRRFAGAGPRAINMEIGGHGDTAGVAVRGRGLHRLCAGGPSLPMGGAPMMVSRHLPGWSCDTRGRPYDGAVRLVLLMLRAAAGDAVRIITTGTPREWRAAEVVAAHAIGVPARLRGPMGRQAALAARAVASPAVAVAPIAGTDLWRASVAGVELAPVGTLATRRDGRVGFGDRIAALAAAEAAAARFGSAAAAAAS